MVVVVVIVVVVVLFFVFVLFSAFNTHRNDLLKDPSQMNCLPLELQSQAGQWLSRFVPGTIS